jgi:hypothetical protein
MDPTQPINTSSQKVENAPLLQETTLDEPVYRTLWRDVKKVLEKVFHVLVPHIFSHKSKGVAALRDWDLWGPLIICLLLALFLYSSAPGDQRTVLFAAAFVIVWVGALIVTLNVILLKGHASFFQSVCLLGYCIFPLMVAAFLYVIVPNTLFRIIVVIIAFLWSTVASVGFFAGMVSPPRKLLATYPVCLFYSVLAWMIIIQSVEIKAPAPNPTP